MLLILIELYKTGFVHPHLCISMKITVNGLGDIKKDLHYRTSSSITIKYDMKMDIYIFFIKNSHDLTPGRQTMQLKNGQRT